MELPKGVTATVGGRTYKGVIPEDAPQEVRKLAQSVIDREKAKNEPKPAKQKPVDKP